MGLTCFATALAAMLAGLHQHVLPGAAERFNLNGTWRVISREFDAKPVHVAPGESGKESGQAHQKGVLSNPGNFREGC